MQTVMLSGVDLAGLEDAAGPTSYARGVTYARQHAVVSMRWDESECAVTGRVHGRLGNFYTTTAYFSSGNGPAMEFAQGDCDCPVGLDCKHVVALVLTAAGFGPTRVTSPARPRRANWDQSLDSLLDTWAADERAPRAGTPLAIELTLSADVPRIGRTATPKVFARPVRAGRNGWVAGGLSWSKLGSLDRGDHPDEHVRLLRELYALYRSSRQVQYYSHEERSLDLSTFDSARLWSMLDDADELGVRLVHGRKRLGDVVRSGSARLLLDATRAGTNGPLTISPVITVAGAAVDPVPVTFIGSPGHGVVYVERADLGAGTDHTEWRLRLARLDEPVHRQLQRLALGDGRIEVPVAEQSRFGTEYYPRLRHLATVISSDDSFTPPAISEPSLLLHARYEAGHRLTLRWEWAYDIGGARRRVPLDGPVAGYRDTAAEHAVLAGLDDVPLERFGLRTTASLLVSPVELRGIDTMLFTTEVLPLLDGQAGVVVEMDGVTADYREVGDSLAIGVATDEVAGETDWFDLDVTITVEGRTVPFLDVFLALAKERSHLLLPDGAYFSLEKPELQALRRLIEEARALQESSGSTLKISRFQAALWDELTQLGVVDRQAAAWERQVNGLLSLESVEQKDVPTTLTASLRPYQVDGYRWLAFLWEHQLGGILADDMGLGKTLQSLALICHAKQSAATGGPFLIVAPTSVVPNWAAEAARFAPGLSVVSISDTLRRRGQSLTETVAGADVVVTSYTLFRLDIDAYTDLSWAGLIMDEAQFAKNHQSKVYQCLRKLPAPVKLAITGTPMENNLMELWSLLSITAPGLFPSPTQFRDYYARPIEKEDDTGLLAQLRRRVRPLIKRRTKEQVAADLPAKLEQVLEVELHPKHRKLYQTVLQRERQKVLGLIDDLDRNRFTILRSLTLLRQLSLHAGLVDDEHQNLPSAKVDALAEQLHEVTGGGHRALVFSQFTGFLATVRARLDADGIEYCYLDGKTRNRKEVLARFKDGAAPVFLISLKAGGFGLNLTEADYCFLLDPWWNPATEAQAVDRTHRIGQTRNVMVYRLIAKDTIEEKVMALKARKAALFTSVMDDGNMFGTGLDADDIRGLFS